MKIVTYILAAMLGLVGLTFVIGFQGSVARILIGVILLAAAGALIYLGNAQPKVSETTTVQKIDLSGDVKLEEIRCRSCNAPLSKEVIEVKAGAIMVSCEHCGATYQFEEAPKW
jgi:hypothetical protein